MTLSTEKMEVELAVAIEVDGKHVTSLKLSRPKVKHLKKIEAIENDFEKAVLLVSILSGLSIDSVEELDASDFATCSEKIESVMAKKPQITGEK
tara:strand:- start:39200 stop:39481 length:282 start_codon:yes stop_codon:yes gene_type:complete